MATALRRITEAETSKIPDASNMCFGIVVSEWNSVVTNALLDGAVSTLEKHGALPENIHVKTVPGSFELIYGAHQMTLNGGYDAIIIPDGGSRNQVSPESFQLHEYDGKMKHRVQTFMKGMDVFSFGITTAPKSIKKLGERFGFDYQANDYFIFHQANMKMNNQIVKKLKLAPEKVPSCMYQFGNTSSASIPLTIASQLKGKIEDKPTKFICCGFGVGLSWGTVAFETNNLVIPDIVNVKDNEDNYGYQL